MSILYTHLCNTSACEIIFGSN